MYYLVGWGYENTIRQRKMTQSDEKKGCHSGVWKKEF